MSKPCRHCGKHYPKSANHDVDSCSGNAGIGAFLSNICREINNSADTTMNVDDRSVHSDDEYVDNDNMQADPSVNAIQIVGDDYSYMRTKLKVPCQGMNGWGVNTAIHSLHSHSLAKFGVELVTLPTCDRRPDS
jgi:hypothetical protein